MPLTYFLTGSVWIKVGSVSITLGASSSVCGVSLKLFPHRWFVRRENRPVLSLTLTSQYHPFHQYWTTSMTILSLVLQKKMSDSEWPEIVILSRRLTELMSQLHERPKCKWFSICSSPPIFPYYWFNFVSAPIASPINLILFSILIILVYFRLRPSTPTTLPKGPAPIVFRKVTPGWLSMKHVMLSPYWIIVARHIHATIT